MKNKNIFNEVAFKISGEISCHIEEFACAYYKRTNFDPRKVVMIISNDYQNARTIIWFEKKRGRSRKEILQNIDNI